MIEALAESEDVSGRTMLWMGTRCFIYNGFEEKERWWCRYRMCSDSEPHFDWEDCYFLHMDFRQAKAIKSSSKVWKMVIKNQTSTKV